MDAGYAANIRRKEANLSFKNINLPEIIRPMTGAFTDKQKVPVELQARARMRAPLPLARVS